VSAVAYAPSPPRDSVALGAMGESAPVAHLVDRLGPSRSVLPAAGSRAPVDRRIFMVLIMLFLLMEWASRRLRGLR
jgi:hypothetical protein